MSSQIEGDYDRIQAKIDQGGYDIQSNPKEDLFFPTEIEDSYAAQK